MTALLAAQARFAGYVAKLLEYAATLPDTLVTLGEAWRSPREAAADAAAGCGIADSLHISRLAIDLNVFVREEYQTDAAAYKPLGLYWQTLDPNCRWGGDFTKPDPDHFSLSIGDGRA